MNFSEISLSEAFDFAKPKRANNTKQKKKCTKGWSCGFTCLPRTKKNCDNGLEGDARTLTEWLEKNSPGKSTGTKTETIPEISDFEKRPRVKMLDSGPGTLYFTQINPPQNLDMTEDQINAASKAIKTLGYPLELPLVVPDIDAFSRDSEKYNIVSGTGMYEAARRAGLKQMYFMLVNESIPDATISSLSKLQKKRSDG